MEKDYSKKYSSESFLKKVRNFGKSAGEDVVRKAGTLYYCLNDSDLPTEHKLTIIGALGYFITPVDAVPDLTPFIGYSDDLGALVLALTTVARSIKPEHKEKAENLVNRIFGK